MLRQNRSGSAPGISFVFICVDSIDQQKDFFLIGFNNFVDSLTVIVTSLLNDQP